MKTIFQTKAWADGGREGKVVNEEAGLTFDLALPGSKAKGNNPEQFFAMGYAACFDSALKLTARMAKADLKSSRTTVEVDLVQDDTGGFSLDVKIAVAVSGLNQTEAEKLVQQAYTVCPYSKATKGNIPPNLSVTVE